MLVIVNMACGLANRMFQYAYYLYLLENGYNVKVDYLKRADLMHEDVAWQRIFPKAVFEQAEEKEVRRMGGIQSLPARIRRKLLPFTTHVIEMADAFDVKPPRKDRDAYLIGVFQNAAVVETVAEILRKRFIFPELDTEVNKDYARRLKTENSVGIHVRKANDYQKIKWYKDTCPVEYYKAAVEFITSRIDKPKFFVFADNKQWVRENFGWLNYEMIEGNPEAGWGSHCDMQLMSLCKHNIISNSTYSWWGGFLNKNQSKTVIMPKVWFNPATTRHFSSEKIQPENWISI